jgi:hypothetical protein
MFFTPTDRLGIAQELRQIAKQIAKSDRQHMAVYCLFWKADGHADGQECQVVSFFPNLGTSTAKFVDCFKETACRSLDDAKMEYKANINEMAQ